MQVFVLFPAKKSDDILSGIQATVYEYDLGRKSIKQGEMFVCFVLLNLQKKCLL